MLMNKNKNKKIIQAMKWSKMDPRMCIQDILDNSTTSCPISFAQNISLVLYIIG
jgi:hypothetical protein